MAVAALSASVSCSEDELDPVSIISVDQYTKNEFDKWLDAKFVTPYNIEFKYRYENIESDLNYYTIPADYECSVILAHLVKYLCVETYDEVGGVDFTRQYFPKEFSSSVNGSTRTMVPTFSERRKAARRFFSPESITLRSTWVPLPDLTAVISRRSITNSPTS